MEHILLLGPGFLLALAIGQLCTPRRNEKNNLLSITCFAWLTHGIGFKMGMLEAYPHLNKLHVPFLAATGALWQWLPQFSRFESMPPATYRRHVKSATDKRGEMML